MILRLLLWLLVILGAWQAINLALRLVYRDFRTWDTRKLLFLFAGIIAGIVLVRG